jgi:hypothetical protein
MPIEHIPVAWELGQAAGGGSAVSLFHHGGRSLDTHVYCCGLDSNPAIGFMRMTDAVTQSATHGWIMPFDGILRWVSVQPLILSNPETATLNVWKSGVKIIDSFDIFNISPRYLTAEIPFVAGNTLSIEVAGGSGTVVSPTFAVGVCWSQ